MLGEMSDLARQMGLGSVANALNPAEFIRQQRDMKEDLTAFYERNTFVRDALPLMAASMGGVTVRGMTFYVGQAYAAGAKALKGYNEGGRTGAAASLANRGLQALPVLTMGAIEASAAYTTEDGWSWSLGSGIAGSGGGINYADGTGYGFYANAAAKMEQDVSATSGIRWNQTQGVTLNAGVKLGDSHPGA